MGCTDPKDKNMITLLCFYETGNELQKNYCLKLKENYQGEKPIKYEIKQIPQVPFGIKLKINGKLFDIQKIFDDREEAMKEAVTKITNLVEGKENETEKGKEGKKGNEKEKEKEREKEKEKEKVKEKN